MAQKAHKPTPEIRRQVETLVGFGMPQPDIARMVGIGLMTLHKYYREELDAGEGKANAQVANSLFKMATSGNVAAAIFWMKTRARWRETAQEIDLNVTAKDVSDDERARALAMLLAKRKKGDG